MDIVVGLSMTPTAIRMVLVEGDRADGVTVEDGGFEFAAANSATERVVAAIVDTREGADRAGRHVTSIGVISTAQLEAALLRDALAARKVDNVMLISAFLAAAALAQAVGKAIGYERIAMLFIEPESATLAVVEAADGAIVEIHKEPLDGVDAITELTGLVAEVEALETRPDGLFVIGSGVDIASMKPQLETATSLVVSAPEQPETALAQGAALASANASLFTPSTDALAYAQYSASEESDADAAASSYPDADGIPGAAESGAENVAYSAVRDEDADAPTAVMGTPEDAGLNERRQQRRPVLLLGSAGVMALVGAIVALEISLALGIRPAAVGLQHVPGHRLIFPMQALVPAPAPAPAPRAGSIRQPGPLAQLPAFAAVAPAPPPPAPAPADPALPAPVVVAPPAPVPDPAIRLSLPTPNYPILVPLPVAPNLPTAQLPMPGLVRPPVSVPVPVSQSPPVPAPVSQPPSALPVAQPPPSALPVPLWQPPLGVPVPVSQPPTRAPVSHAPTHVPVQQPPAYVHEPRLPVNVPAPDPLPVPGVPGLEAPPPIGQPALEGPLAPGSPGLGGAPAPDVPPVIPQLPHSLTPSTQEPLPTRGGGGGGGPVGAGGPVGGGGPVGAGGPVGGGGLIGGGGPIGGGGGGGGGGSSSGGPISGGGGSSGGSSSGGSGSGGGSFGGGGGGSGGHSSGDGGGGHGGRH